MCELLGLNFKLVTTPTLSFRGFKKRGDANPHGWGLAFYPDATAQIHKEPLRAEESHLASLLTDYEHIRSSIFIGHVRLATKGNTAHRNTHPFDRELNGAHFVFAHNGTLKGFKELKLGRFIPIGETDSEHAFCYLLDQIAARGTRIDNEDDFRWLHETLRFINETGTFNCIFSNGTHLFCYHDKEGHNGLTFVTRQPPFPRVRMVDEDWEIDLSTVKGPEQRACIVATRPLTNENWTSFHHGELIAFKDGRVAYRSHVG